MNQWELLDKLFAQFQDTRVMIMGLKEDFAAFKTAVMDALTEITDDIQRLKEQAAAGANTPQEIIDGMAEIQSKLGVVRNLDNPTTPTEPPL